MKRRHFLRYAALSGASAFIPVGIHGCALRGEIVQGLTQSPATPTNSAATPRLIVILLRGAADGLNIVVPYGDSAYYDHRPKIAVPPPGDDDGAIDLDGHFGLHPALADLLPQWKQGHLAFVHNTGLPAPIRSHFEAQDYMESAIVGGGAITDGWMNRLIQALTPTTSTQSVSFGGLTPISFWGAEAIANVSLGADGLKPLAIDRPSVQDAFDQLYAGNDTLSQMYREGRAARTRLLQELDTTWLESAQQNDATDDFSRSTHALAQLMVGDTQTQVAFMELDGWDTHVNQAFGLNRQLTLLNRGLKTLINGLGRVYQDTTIVVMSEFGRTVAENGNRGTDHGHGNVMWLMGGQLNGQRMYGEWSGVAKRNLNEGRDLTVTTDYRDVLASVLTQKWTLNTEQLTHIFPNYSISTSLQFT